MKTVKIAIVAVFLAVTVSACVVAPAEVYYPAEPVVYGPPPPVHRAYVAPAPVVPFMFGGVYIHGGHGGHYRGGHYRGGHGGHRR